MTSQTGTPYLARGSAGWTPDPFHQAIAARGEELRRELERFLDRNPDLPAGAAGRLVTLAGKAAALADLELLERLERAWRRD